MTGPTGIWKEERLVESFDVDMYGGMRPHRLLGLLLNAAWNAARESVYGYEELSARNLMWVLMKVQLRIDRTPRWREQVVLETWGKGVRRLFALRDFSVTSPVGEPLASATTLWMILDKTRGRPQRIDTATDGFPWLPSREALPASLEKVPALDGGREGLRVRVQFSDIDVNRHVNAARYLQWLVDAQGPSALERTEPASIEISYLAEAVAGEEVAVHVQGPGHEPGQVPQGPARPEDAGPRLAVIRRVGDDQELCRATIGWRARAAGG